MRALNLLKGYKDVVTIVFCSIKHFTVINCQIGSSQHLFFHKESDNTLERSRGKKRKSTLNKTAQNPVAETDAT